MDKLVQFYRKLNREDFLEEEYKNYADLDKPLPIGFGQTISQPTLVLQMTRDLMLNQNHKVLEIGTGSGYQTAFLAKFAASVYTVERFQNLSEKAQKRMEKLGFKNVQYKIGDGSHGWDDHAPYDRIIVTAAAAKTPVALIKQLVLGGIMIIPVGERDLQELIRITKNSEENLQEERLSLVRFVELVGEYGWKEL